MANQNGLEWIKGRFDQLEPRWTAEPKIEVIEILARKHFNITDEAPCKVTFYAQGAHNKLYKIETADKTLIMRVSLPLDPHNKTRSEVATIEFVHRHTDISTAKIYAYDASSQNELGFEWILMEMLPGSSLKSKWRKVTMERKLALVEEIVKYQAQLFQIKFSGIGNIFDETVTDASESKIGRIVSMFFIWGDHITWDVPRGPFRNSYDWLRTRVQFILDDQARILKLEEKEDEIEDAEAAKGIAERLLRLLPSAFAIDTPNPETTVLFHDDISFENILVDEGGTITGIVDWEWVSTLPVWRACQLPAFLEGRERTEEPDREIYAKETDSDNERGDYDNEIDNEGVNELYWNHQLEYEISILRQHFLNRMKEVEPRWIEEAEKGKLKADIEAAIYHCDTGLSFRLLRKWLDEVDGGDITSLRSRLHQ